MLIWNYRPRYTCRRPITDTDNCEPFFDLLCWHQLDDLDLDLDLDLLWLLSILLTGVQVLRLDSDNSNTEAGPEEGDVKRKSPPRCSGIVVSSTTLLAALLCGDVLNALNNIDECELSSLTYLAIRLDAWCEADSQEQQSSESSGGKTSS